MRKDIKLGDEVTVEFMGKVSEAKLLADGKIVYAVTSDKGAFAGWLTDIDLWPMRTPEEIK